MRSVHYILLFFFAFLFYSSDNPRNHFGIPEYENEAMHYIVKYGMFNIGEADIIFSRDSVQGSFCLKAMARSTGLVTLVKRINYVYISNMDTVTSLPWNFIIDVKDNRSYYYNKLTFDRETREDSTILHSHLSGIHVIPTGIHDIMTGFYHFRENKILESKESGEAIVIKTFLSDKLWDLRIRYLGKEKINTTFGRMNCLKFNSSTVVGDFFKNDDDMTIWISDDLNHVPVRIQLNLTIGIINGYLVNYRNSRQGDRF